MSAADDFDSAVTAFKAQAATQQANFATQATAQAANDAAAAKLSDANNTVSQGAQALNDCNTALANAAAALIASLNQPSPPAEQPAQ